MSFVAFNGLGYNSFVAESTNLVQWTNPRLAMGFGNSGEFDHGGRAIGAFLYESYEIKAARRLKRHDGKFWTLYGCYPRQGGYELRSGYEGVACSDDGLTWQRARNIAEGEDLLPLLLRLRQERSWNRSDYQRADSVIVAGISADGAESVVVKQEADSNRGASSSQARDAPCCER